MKMGIVIRWRNKQSGICKESLINLESEGRFVFED